MSSGLCSILMALLTVQNKEFFPEVIFSFEVSCDWFTTIVLKVRAVYQKIMLRDTNYLRDNYHQFIIIDKFNRC